jgi:sugar-specific transcriptional regulator TrmB
MELEELQNRNVELENEVRELKEKLKKYTAPERTKKFYENHKEEIKQRNKEYAEKVNYYATISAEKKKQYARTAYLNHKEKVRKAKELEQMGQHFNCPMV